jgi:hypothetical protein
VGGVSAAGAVGKVIGSIVGALVMVSLTNGMNLMGIDISLQYIMRGRAGGGGGVRHHHQRPRQIISVLDRVYITMDGELPSTFFDVHLSRTRVEGCRCPRKLEAPPLLCQRERSREVHPSIACIRQAAEKDLPPLRNEAR